MKTFGLDLVVLVRRGDRSAHVLGENSDFHFLPFSANAKRHALRGFLVDFFHIEIRRSFKVVRPEASRRFNFCYTFLSSLVLCYYY